MTRLRPLLLLAALCCAVLATLPALAGAADPNSGTVDPTTSTFEWQGETYASVNPITCPSTAEDPDDSVCDHVTLTVGVDGKYWGFNDGEVVVAITSDDEDADFDLFVYDSDGTLVGDSATGGSNESVTLDEPSGTYEIRVQPFTSVAATYTGTATFSSTEATGDGASAGGDVPTETVTDAPCIDGLGAGVFPCDGIDLLSFLPLSEMNGGEASDIWGWTDPETGDEYAIIGNTLGVNLVRITDPTAPVYLGHLAHPSLTTLVWNDMKVFENTLYVVADLVPHGIEVFDLTQLREVTEPQTWLPDLVVPLPVSAHNIAINEDTGFAYGVGGQGQCAGGAVFFDLTGDLPTIAGCDVTDGYVHDAHCVVYAGPDAEHSDAEICVNSNEDTVTITDVSDKLDPVILARQGYEGAEYTHQGWLTEDHQYFLLGDELDEQAVGGPTRTYIWDVRDLDAPELIGVHEGRTEAIDHNMYVNDGLLYQSNYEAGLSILDLADVADGVLTEIAWFDTYPASDNAAFNGTWSNYPFFESGTIAVSGIDEGLFLLRPSPVDRVEREFGTDRVATAIAVSKRAYPSAPAAVLARSHEFPDALAAATLATEVGGPILLTGTAGLDERVADELARLGADTVYLLGGPAALSTRVAADVTDLGVTVERIGGTDRYETAAMIADKVVELGGPVDGAIVALGRRSGGDAFPDALAASQVASRARQPILLVAEESLPAATAEVLDRVVPDGSRVLIAGGTAAVSQGVEDAIALLGYQTDRAAGVDRYETATALADRALELGASGQTAWVASGADFADALAAGPAAAVADAVVLLTRPTALPAATAAWLDGHREDVNLAVLLGGERAIAADVDTSVLASILEPTT